MVTKQHKRIADAVLPPWVIIADQTFDVVSFQTNDVREEVKPFARLPQVLPDRAHDLSEVVTVYNDGNVDVASGHVLATDDATVHPQTSDPLAVRLSARFDGFQ